MYKAKDYEYSVPYKGSAKEALSVARVSVLSLGFEITLDTENELHADGPGMHSNQQPDLMGVSTFRFRIDPGQIAVTGRYWNEKLSFVFPAGFGCF